MRVFKNSDRGYWEVSFWYSEYTGKRKKKHKRGFKTKKEAIEWGNSFLAQNSSGLDMKFRDFVHIYYEDMEARLRENTMRTKKYIVELKIIPYFGERIVTDISAADVRKWQTDMMKQNYSKTYLKTINNQLSAIFNYAVKYYDLTRNPCIQAGGMGREKADEMDFWTEDEFNQFIDAVSNKKHVEMAFKVLFWTGCRLGEMLALTFGDLYMEGGAIRINKSLQRIEGRDVITEPKTPKGKRVVTLPDFMVDELKEYMDKMYGYSKKDRVFPLTKYIMEKEMERGVKASGVKRIRVHDLRHSHASLLINMGVDPLEIAERLGHEKIQTTLETYGHLYPQKAHGIADKLSAYHKENEMKKEDGDARDT